MKSPPISAIIESTVSDKKILTTKQTIYQLQLKIQYAKEIKNGLSLTFNPLEYPNTWEESNIVGKFSCGS